MEKFVVSIYLNMMRLSFELQNVFHSLSLKRPILIRWRKKGMQNQVNAKPMNGAKEEEQKKNIVQKNDESWKCGEKCNSMRLSWENYENVCQDGTCRCRRCSRAHSMMIEIELTAAGAAAAEIISFSSNDAEWEKHMRSLFSFTSNLAI